MSDRIDRRRFLKVLGVTGGGAAVLSGCGIGPEPTEKLIPYLIAPEDQIPGTPTWYSTTCRECPAGCGLHAKVREGRVIKLEGNPDSPINHGRLCARGQAALQGRAVAGSRKPPGTRRSPCWLRRWPKRRGRASSSSRGRKRARSASWW